MNQLSLVKDAPETIQRAFLMDFFGKRNPAAKRDSISKALFRLINKAKQEGMVREGKKGLSLTPKAVPQKDIQTTEEF
ncbi:MAG: hypothetical protein NTY53_21905 [Kiritimatiellaeota bacterium]|nr:hypothetical protein [Kiritimatiellota bacterium]